MKSETFQKAFKPANFRFSLKLHQLIVHLAQMNEGLVYAISRVCFSREQVMPLCLDVLECFSALFIDPLKLLSLILKFYLDVILDYSLIFPCICFDLMELSLSFGFSS